MKNLLILLVIISMWSCKSTKIKDIAELYPLIERNEKLKNGKEWETMHNMYTKLTQQIRLDPTKAKPYIELAELAMMEARVTGEHGHYYPMALALLKIGKSKAPKDDDIQFRALSDIASVQLSLHQFANGKATALQAIQFNPYNAQIYGALVDASVELGDYKSAVEYADKMVSIRPDLRSYSRVSYLREIYGDMTGALEAMLQAVESGYPGYEETAWTRLQLGELYKKMGNLDQAEIEYNTILQERPNYAFALAALADIKLARNENTSATELLDQAIAILPEVSFYISKAELLKKMDKKDEAVQIGKEVLDMLADDEEAGHTMDLTYAEVYQNLLNDKTKALEYAMKEYKERPMNAEVNKYLADYYTSIGDHEKASMHKAKTKIIKSES